jgi:hypothetical protein
MKHTLHALMLAAASLTLTVTGCSPSTDPTTLTSPPAPTPTVSQVEEPVSPEPSPTCTTKVECMGGYNGEQGDVRKGQPFTTGAFEVTVTDVKLGVKEIPSMSKAEIEEYGPDYATEPNRPKNGQFVVVAVTAMNVSKQPAPFSTTSSQIVDGQERFFDAVPVTLPTEESIELEDLQPSTTRKGILVFDVTADVTSVKLLMLQTDPYMLTDVAPVGVDLR